MGAKTSALWAVAAFTSALGCSSDIFDVGVELTPQKFPIDFGTTTGTVPVVSCTTQNIAVCGTSTSQPLQLENGVGQVDVNLGCDAAVSQCYVQAQARLSYTVDVLQDESFTSKVGRKAVTTVRMLDIAYTVPTNTTTFDIPQVDVYVGPAGTTTPNDPGVEPVDSIPPLPAKTVITTASPRHLTLEDGSPARDLIERNIKAKSPFVFIVTTAPRMNSGSPMPAGTMQLEIRPLLGLGLR